MHFYFKETLFDFNKCFERKGILTLMECLWDTYVNNKNLALQLVLKIDNQLFKDYV